MTDCCLGVKSQEVHIIPPSQMIRFLSEKDDALSDCFHDDRIINQFINVNTKSNY